MVSVLDRDVVGIDRDILSLAIADDHAWMVDEDDAVDISASMICPA